MFWVILVIAVLLMVWLEWDNEDTKKDTFDKIEKAIFGESEEIY